MSIKRISCMTTPTSENCLVIVSIFKQKPIFKIPTNTRMK